MSTDPAVEQVEGTMNGEGPQRSVLDVLRAQRAGLAAKKIHEVEIPGYRGLMALRLGPIPGPHLNRIIDRATNSRSAEGAFTANADMLIAACQEVVGRSTRDDPWTVLVNDSGQPVRLDETLAEMLGLEAQRARDVVMELFAGANSPEMAVGVAAGEYAQWAASANADIDEDLLGESSAAPK